MNTSRRVARILLVVATVPIALAAIAVVVSQTPWFKDWLRGVIQRQASTYIDGSVQIGRLRGNLFFDTRLEQVSVTFRGRPVIAVDRVSLDYNPFRLLAGAIAFDEIRLERPVVHLDSPAGVGLAGLLKPAEAGTPPAVPRPIAVGQLVIDSGTVIVGPSPEEVGGLRVPDRITDLEVSLAVHGEAGRTVVDIHHLSLAGQAPDVTLKSVTGRIVLDGGALAFDHVSVRLADSAFVLNGTIENLLEASAPREAEG
jgi:hypothetical protein